MSKNRLEAFSDGVIAILITIMVFDIKPPSGSDFISFLAVVPMILTYLLSYVFLGIYWNNHHHLLALAPRTTGGVLWANLHFLFWLSLIPFTTNWLRTSDFQSFPTALYGVVLLGAACAYLILQQTIIAIDGHTSKLKQAIGNDVKGRVSIGLYALAVICAWLSPWISLALYVSVALIWLVPDRRIESHVDSTNSHENESHKDK